MLLIYFLSFINLSTCSQTPQTPLAWPDKVYQWIQSLFITNKIDLDLSKRYKKKESKYSATILDPAQSALKFRLTIIEAATKNNIMARFKDNPEKFLFGASSSHYQYEGGLDDTMPMQFFIRAKNCNLLVKQ